LAKSAWRGTNAIASWSWRGCEKRKATVEVYADCAYIELSLNGKITGRKKVKQYRAVFKVRYMPGILTATAIGADGGELSHATLESATGPLRIAVLPEANTNLDLRRGSGEVYRMSPQNGDTVKAGQPVYVNICITGENGVVESNADEKLTVSVEGGKLLAFGSANPRTEENYTDGKFTTFYGRALAVAAADDTGSMKITVEGGNLPPASAKTVSSEK
jgi:hypothetical protein